MIELGPERQLAASGAVFRGKVTHAFPYREERTGRIHTRATFRVLEVFKGRLEKWVNLDHPGGSLDGIVEMDSSAPDFGVGDERLLFVSRRADRTVGSVFGAPSALRLSGSGKLALQPEPNAGQKWLRILRQLTTQGPLPGADLTGTPDVATALGAPADPAARILAASSSTTNLLADTQGVSARFIMPDRGEPIPYIVDADYLPVGITRTQALQAVQQALSSWSSVSSVRFVFEGFQSFGASAPNLPNMDGKLRIQLHDHYNLIGTSGLLLGRGGNRWASNSTEDGWSLGGRVSGNDFHKVVSGWVVLRHTEECMRDPVNFSEVLCHELGHALSLGHSSEDPEEPNPELRNALMYYQSHGNGRGTLLDRYDKDVISQLYPVGNTPPYTFDRFMDVVTTPQKKKGLNFLTLTGYDMQTTNLAIEVAGATTHTGLFTISNNVAWFDPSAYANGPWLDPALKAYYDRFYFRFNDGTNASPYALVSVVSLNPDQYNEGVPDAWRMAHFGSANPAAGPARRAQDDFDRDGFCNVTEYRLGSDPADPASNFKISSIGHDAICWQAKPWELYEILSTDSAGNWTGVKPIIASETNGSTVLPTNGAPVQLFRLRKVP